MVPLNERARRKGGRLGLNAVPTETEYYEYNFCYDDVMIENIVSVELE